MNFDESTGNFEFKYECDSTETYRLPLVPYLPSFEDFGGIYDFSLVLYEPQQGKKSSYYSTVLKQVFIDMDKVLLVHFQLDGDATGLLIRALPVYCSPDYAGIPVARCSVHSIANDPKGKAHEFGRCDCQHYNNVGHVVRSQSPEARYCFDESTGRHSVVVPVKRFQAGAHTYAIAYYFTCKTSCPTGMRRRPINVVFTLENLFGEILARRVLGVRICSCPKRDMDRMEKDTVQRELRSRTPSRSKRLRNKSHPTQPGQISVAKIRAEIEELNTTFHDYQSRITGIIEAVESKLF